MVAYVYYICRNMRPLGTKDEDTWILKRSTGLYSENTGKQDEILLPKIGIRMICNSTP